MARQQIRRRAFREALHIGSEDELPAEFQIARTVVAGDGAEVAVVAAGIDALEDGVVERVEGLEAQLDASSVLVQRNGLEERKVPVEDARSDSRILAGCTKP